jgi:hypothetical protein
MTEYCRELQKARGLRAAKIICTHVTPSRTDWITDIFSQDSRRIFEYSNADVVMGGHVGTFIVWFPENPEITKQDG